MSSTYLSVDSETDTANSRVLQKVFAFLDWKSKKVVRRVCRSWKEELDDSGLNIKINNRSSRNVEFVSKTLAKKINVVNIESKYKRVQLKYPNEIISVKCIGKIEPLWFIKEILIGCENLTELHLTGSFLISQEIGNIKNIRSDSKILMQNLKILRIEFGVAACQEYLNLHTPQGIIHRVLTLFNPTKNAFLSMRQILDTNMTFLLSQIRSSKLNILYIYVDLFPYGLGGLPREVLRQGVPYGYFEKYNFEWKNSPITGFLDFHRTLARIYLPHFQGQDCSSDDRPDSTTGCPENLKTLEITLIHPQAQIESGPQSFMQNLLLVQKSLEEIRFQTTDWRDSEQGLRFGVSYQPLNFEQVFVNNSSSLTYIHLNIYKNTLELLTGYTFQNCFNLETFILEYRYDNRVFGFGGPPDFYNFNVLPKSLKTICISVAVVADPELCETLDFHQFYRLQNLTLWNIRVNHTNLISSTIMNALRSRHLNCLSLSFSYGSFFTFREDMPPDAIVALANPTGQADIDDDEPFHTLKIYGPPYDYDARMITIKGSHFLSIDPNGRTDFNMSYGRRSEQTWFIPLDWIIVRCNVYDLSNNV